jgi:hypothetical protein
MEQVILCLASLEMIIIELLTKCRQVVGSCTRFVFNYTQFVYVWRNMSKIYDNLCELTFSLEEACRIMDDYLSLDYLQYDVDFNGIKFALDRPTTEEEKIEFVEEKKKLITLMLKDYFEQLIPHVVKYYDDESFDGNTESEWFKIKFAKEAKIAENLTLFELMAMPPEAFQSNISPEEYDKVRKIIRTGGKKGVSLDLDSTYVNMDREGWSEEKQYELIKKKENES